MISGEVKMVSLVRAAGLFAKLEKLVIPMNAQRWPPATLPAPVAPRIVSNTAITSRGTKARNRLAPGPSNRNLGFCTQPARATAAF
jgi:hypothetical protein